MDAPNSLLTTMRCNFIYVDHYTFGKNWIYPESYVPYCMVRYILKGKAIFTINRIDYEVKENQVVYIPDGCQLACYSLENAFSFISIRFIMTARLNGNDFLSEFFHISPVNNITQANMLTYFQEVYQNAISKNLNRYFKIRGNLELILATLMDINMISQEAVEGPVQQSTYELIYQDPTKLESIQHREIRTGAIKQDPRIQIAIEYIISHPQEMFCGKSLCYMAGMSPSSFRRKFKEHTGKCCGDFIKELKLMTVARRLLTTDQRISDIAYEFGFKDPNYFWVNHFSYVI